MLDRAEQEAETPLPGYTHLQRAQPVTVGHHLLAWVEMLDRDRARLRFACAQAAPSPLGAAALAGSTLPLPAPEGETMRNSLDAVADRDFALDYLYACAMLASHLSRIGEELVLWSTSEFAFVRLPERAATGSSAMPQKLNPDVAELVRGKAGAALGRLAGLLATVKGLPLAYNRDLQEDKPPVFAARRDLRLSLDALAVLVGELTFDRGRLAAACADPLLLATDAAEQLVGEGVPFREAHERVAASVRAGTFEPPGAPGLAARPGRAAWSPRWRRRAPVSPEPTAARAQARGGTVEPCLGSSSLGARGFSVPTSSADLQIAVTRSASFIVVRPSLSFPDPFTTCTVTSSSSEGTWMLCASSNQTSSLTSSLTWLKTGTVCATSRA